MKGFVISIAMLSLAVGLTVYLSVYGYNASEKLAEKAALAYTAPESKKEEIADELSLLWDKYSPILSLSLHKSEIENTSAMITKLCELTDDSDPTVYKTLCRLLYEQFQHEKELHTVTFDGVF